MLRRNGTLLGFVNQVAQTKKQSSRETARQQFFAIVGEYVVSNALTEGWRGVVTVIVVVVVIVMVVVMEGHGRRDCFGGRREYCWSSIISAVHHFLWFYGAGRNGCSLHSCWRKEGKEVVDWCYYVVYIL